MFIFNMVLIIILITTVLFILCTRVEGMNTRVRVRVNALKHKCMTSYLALKHAKTHLTKQQIVLNLSIMLATGVVLVIGTLLTYYLKFMFNGRSNDIYNSEPLYGSSEHRTLHPLSYIDEDDY